MIIVIVAGAYCTLITKLVIIVIVAGEDFTTLAKHAQNVIKMSDGKFEIQYQSICLM